MGLGVYEITISEFYKFAILCITYSESLCTLYPLAFYIKILGSNNPLAVLLGKIGKMCSKRSEGCESESHLEPNLLVLRFKKDIKL